jgi:hypothetical protein
MKISGDSFFGKATMLARQTSLLRIVGEFDLYMVVLLKSYIFVVFDVTTTVLVLYIHYINSLKEIFINH